MTIVELFGEDERGAAVAAGRSVRMRDAAEVPGRSTEAEAEAEKAERARALGGLVFEHRDRLALSQEEYAERAGIGRTRLSQVEGGKVWPSRRTRAKLAAAMDVPPEDLWQRVEDRVGSGSYRGVEAVGRRANTEDRKAI